MIEVRIASEAPGDVQQKISQIFIEGFGQHFRRFAKDEQTLVKGLAHMFVPAVFYVALLDGEIGGIAACTDGRTNAIELKWRELIKHLGFIRGLIANAVFKSYFQRDAFGIRDRTASIELVATARQHRGKGMATALIQHFFTLPQYDEYVLEVADTNTNALRLYERLGFQEFKRIPQNYSRLSGVNELVYLGYTCHEHSPVKPTSIE